MKNHRKRLIIAGFFLVLIVSIYAVLRIKSHNKEKLSDAIISSLENYKKKNGTYPLQLENINMKDGNWIYYSPDSSGNFYTLSYSQGIMGVNTMKYFSQTKKWVKEFNY